MYAGNQMTTSIKPKKHLFQAQMEDKGKRLDAFIAEKLNISKAVGRRLIMIGSVYLNKKRIHIASKSIFEGSHIEVFYNPTLVKTDPPFELKQTDILYEDDVLIFVNKPTHFPTQPTLDDSRNNLFKELKRYLDKRDKKDSYVGLHHRLDKDTSGVIVFTKSKDVNKKLAESFQERSLIKKYLALTEKSPYFTFSEGEVFTIKNHLKKTPGKKAKMLSVRSGGDYAHTDFKVLQILQDSYLIESTLHTGRMHQIRAHLSEKGVPVCGDLHYGAKEKKSRIFLHAHSLELIHPLTGQPLKVESPVPVDFKKCLNSSKTF